MSTPLPGQPIVQPGLVPAETRPDLPHVEQPIVAQPAPLEVPAVLLPQPLPGAEQLPSRAHAEALTPVDITPILPTAPIASTMISPEDQVDRLEGTDDLTTLEDFFSQGPDIQ